MNKNVTSKEHILSVTQEIAKNEGLANISIRKVAERCNIAIGSIYNYYPTKSALIIAVIENFWCGLFHRDICTWSEKIRFTESFEDIYHKFYTYLQEFRHNFLQQIASLTVAEKEAGRKAEAETFRHIQKGFLALLERDTQIREDIWDEKFTKEDFSLFLFANMMCMLRNDQTDCTFLIELLNRLLYT